MLSVPVYDEAGQQVGSESIEPGVLGGEVNASLLKQAIVAYAANRRQGTVAQKTRGEVEGSSRKLYKQKGTGRARTGNLRNPIKRGGGRAFPRKPRDFSLELPRKMRRLARNQAVLSKIQSQDALIVTPKPFEAPKTKRLAAMLKAVNATKGCVLATRGVDSMVYRSGRNIPRTQIVDVAQLNAHDILSRRKLIFTREAFDAFRQALAAAGKGE
ncbi:MAG: 50S ribosomal protein L4 [Phycisphaerae bacterium]